METKEKNGLMLWRAVVAITMVVTGFACFVLGSVCAMIISGKSK